MCWGNNATKIFGADSVDPASPVALPIEGLRSLAPGGELGVGSSASHMCMTDRTGTVCWGSAGNGELGVEGPAGTIYGAIATAVSSKQGTAPLTHVAIGGTHSCALDAKDALYCWGANYSGQMGPSNVNSIKIPISLVVTEPLIAVSSQRQTCGITADHHAICFGDNTLGGLGRGTLGDSIQPTPLPVLDVDGGGRLSGVSQISTGDHFTCARLASTCGEAGPGPVVCWGRAVDGELGVAVDGGASPFPRAVQSP
jgi:alpha-tubulin suppressor-like RCC1 family protein